MRKIIYIQDHEIYSYKGRYYHSKSAHYFSRYLVGLKANEKLVVYTGIREVKDENKIKKYQDITNDCIEYVRIPEFRKLGNLLRILAIVKRAVKNADYCYLRPCISATIASYYCKKWNKPYLAIVTGDPYEAASHHSRYIVKLAAWPLLLSAKFLIKNATAALYVTQAYLQSRYPCKGESLGCSDVDYLNINKDSLDKRIRKINEQKDLILLGSVGNVSTVIKGHDTVIKALAVLKAEGKSNYIYQLVGGGNPERLTNLATKFGVSDQLAFMGEYSHDCVLDWFETIDIYIHPSRSEGLPRTIIEAMTKATPCICSTAGGIPELINENFLFDYDGNEILSCVNAIKRMSKDNMLNEAVNNFAHSKDYDPTMLGKKRDSYLEKMLDLNFK